MINEGRQANNTILCKTEGGTEGGGNHGKYFRNGIKKKKEKKLMREIKIFVKRVMLQFFYGEKENILTPQKEPLHPVH